MNDKIRELYSSQANTEIGIRALSDLPECSLETYSPYLKKENKEISLYALFDGGAFDPPNKLVVVGERGVGKTTLIKSIAYNWSVGTLWNSNFDSVYLADFKLMFDDDWLFSYEKYDIDDPKIFMQCLVHGSIAKFFGQKNSKDIGFKAEDINLFGQNSNALILFDNYDKTLKEDKDFKNISELIFNYPNILVTSDPKSIKLRDEKKYDIKIEHFGISDAGIDQFQDEYFFRNENKARSFEDFINKNEWAKNFCRVPYNLFILGYLCNGEKIESKTSSELYFNFIKRFTSDHVRYNYPGFEERGNQFFVNLNRLLANCADKMLNNEINGQATKDQPYNSVQNCINYLLDHQEIGYNSGGIISFKEINDYNLLVPKKQIDADSLETALHSLKFIFEIDTLQDYLIACNMLCILLGDNLQASKKLIKDINPDNYSDESLSRLKYVSGLLGIVQSNKNNLSIFTNNIGTNRVPYSFRAFWQAATKDIYKDYDNETLSPKIVFLTTLLGQIDSKLITEDLIPNHVKVLDLIDLSTLYDFINLFTNDAEKNTEAWVNEIKSSNYVSSRMQDFILNGLENPNIQSLFNKFQSLRVNDGLKEYFSDLKDKLGNSIKHPVESVSNEIKMCCLQLINNHWGQFVRASSVIDKNINLIFNTFTDKKANWNLIKLAMSCKLKIDNMDARQATGYIKFVESILDQIYLLDVDLKFVNSVAKYGVFRAKGKAKEIDTTSLEKYLIPKNNLRCSDLGAKYVSRFLKTTNKEDGLREDVVTSLNKYFFDKDDYVRFSAVKISVNLLLSLDYKEIFEDISDGLIRMINDPIETIRIYSIQGLFNLISLSNSDDLVDNYLPKLNDKLNDENNRIRSVTIKGIADVISSKNSQDLLDSYLFKILNCLESPNDKDDAMSAIIHIINHNNHGNDPISQDDLLDPISQKLNILLSKEDLVQKSSALELFSEIANSNNISLNKRTEIVEDFLPRIQQIASKYSQEQDEIKILAISSSVSAVVAINDQDMMSEYITKLLPNLSNNSEKIRSSVIENLTKIIINLKDQDLLEENTPKFISLFEDSSQMVKISALQAVSDIVFSLINKKGSLDPNNALNNLDLIEEYILKLAHVVSDDTPQISNFASKKVTAIIINILHSKNINDLLDDILKLWIKYLNKENDDIRDNITKSVSELLVRSYIKTNDFESIDSGEKIVKTFCQYIDNEEIYIKLSSINGVTATSAALKASDLLTENILPTLSKNFFKPNLDIANNAISGACSIAAFSYKNNDTDYIIDKLIPKLIEALSNADETP